MTGGNTELKLVHGAKKPFQTEMFSSEKRAPVEHDPPNYLGTEARAFWNEVCAHYHLESHHLRLLESACSCWDRIVAAREQIEADGVFIKDRYGQLKTHPAFKVEHDSKIVLARLLRELQLDVGLEESRPPSLY